jgi:two-component system, NtrC family, sensor kinase
MKLAPKLTVFLVAAMFVVLAFDAWVGIWREMTLLESDMRTDESNTGRVLGAAIAEVWRVDGRERALQVVADANASAGEIRVRWVQAEAPAGTEVAPRLPEAVAQLGAGQVFSRVDRKRESPGRLYTYIPVRVGGHIEGALELSESLAAERGYVRSLILQRAVTVGALALLFGVLASVLGNWLVGVPMRRLVAKARRVGRGDFSTPLAVRQQDEIGALAREIDAMCDQLEAAHARIDAETNARITALEQLRHADRLATVGQLASGVAHELGTPLNVVAQRAKMISTGEVTGSEAADGARIVFEQAQRITGVIRQLLDFARRRTPQKACADLGGLAAQTASFLAPLGRKRAVEIHVEHPSPPVQAAVDAGQMQQVLTNLMVNGIQSMPRGGTLRVTVGSQAAQPPADVGGPAQEYRTISVQDQGEGIAAEHLPHLFEPFFTTKDVGEGTGLGLAVAYGIVREHAGWIGVESAPGHGSTFTIFLPAGDTV